MLRRQNKQTDAWNPLSALVFFSWILVVQLTGLAAFTKGFFLTRVELGRQSECDVRSLLTNNEFAYLSEVAQRQQRAATSQDPPDDDGCWLPQRFKRVVWVVVDALRFDFAAFTPPEAEGQGGHGHTPGARHYLNHLPVIREAIGEGVTRNASPGFEGSAGLLFQFEADPPTVTMQRLKGLTTGGLPTFIDFRDNFHSPEIAEDNWVAQIRARAARRRKRGGRKGGAVADGGGDGGGELVFMGDDTWTSLYPSYFSRSYPFPSFNTRDLHTVDDGVLSHLATELASNDWDVLVAHFLGVDHVGHTFGPASQAMEDKLGQMDAALRTVFASVDDETVVFVLGDHGMTEDGNHGGATPEETGAALLVWSRSGDRLLGFGHEAGKTVGNGDGHGDIRGASTWGGGEDHAVGGSLPSTSRKVAQIDLVPTVSLLLGTPIPYGSLGGVIPEVFAGPYSGLGDAERESAAARAGAEVGRGAGRGVGYYERLGDALLVNSVQVWRYLSEYARVASMPKQDMFDLQQLLTAARSAHAEWRRQSQSRSGTARDDAASEAHLRQVCDSYREFLDASIGLGRSLWTQYDTGLMWWGLAVLLMATLALAARVVTSAMVAEERGGIYLLGQGGAGAGAGYFGVLGGGVGLTGALFGHFVFESSGTHIFLAKAAICSCLGVCWYSAQTLWTRCHPRLSASNNTDRQRDGAATLGAAATAALAALYCAGLFSNSFIEAEDGLHRFLGASALLSLAGLLFLTPPSPKIHAAATTISTRTAVTADDRFLGLVSLSATPTAALYTVMAAACLRAAAAVQESAGGFGVSTEATFGVARSLLPLPALWYLCSLACGGRKGGHFHGLLQALSLAAVGAYWVVEALTVASTEHGGPSGGISNENTAQAAEGLLLFGSLPPARLLLPRVAYLLCIIGVVGAMANPSARSGTSTTPHPLTFQVKRARDNPSNTAVGEGQERAFLGQARAAFLRDEGTYGTEAATAAAKVITHLVPVVVVLLGPASPAVVFFMASACGCVLRGLSIASGAGVKVPQGAVAVAWSVVGRAFFFLTGHHNQFSRLQYSAAFVGFDEFDFKVGGLLLFLNTFGTEILAALTLPLAAAAAAPRPRGPFRSSASAPIVAALGSDGGSAEGSTPSGDTAAESARRRGATPRRGVTSEVVGRDSAVVFGDDSKVARHDAEGGDRNEEEEEEEEEEEGRLSRSGALFLRTMERLSGLVLLLSSARTFLSAANVSVQRGHLMLWAVFAPKFVFDATMQAVCGAAAIASWAVVVLSLRHHRRRRSVSSSSSRRRA